MQGTRFWFRFLRLNVVWLQTVHVESKRGRMHWPECNLETHCLSSDAFLLALLNIRFLSADKLKPVSQLQLRTRASSC